MNIGPIDLDHEILVIAEIGNNHEGSYSRAEEMIGRAAEAGAQAVKFQTIVPENLVTKDQTARLETLHRLQFNQSQFESLANFARKSGVMFLSTPFDPATVDWLDPLVPAFKVASGDNDYTPLLRRIAATGKPVILSTGLAGPAEVAFSRDVIRNEWNLAGFSNPGIALLHCVVSYPTVPDEANLGAIRQLQLFGEVTGYSDHTLGIDAAVAAAALGARVIEKHFTLDKNLSDFRDHQLSADPIELSEMIARIKLISRMLGDGVKRVMPSETAAVKAIQRGVYAAHDLSVGMTVGAADVQYLRPRVALAPAEFDTLLGQKLTRPVAVGEPLRATHFA